MPIFFVITVFAKILPFLSKIVDLKSEFNDLLLGIGSSCPK